MENQPPPAPAAPLSETLQTPTPKRSFIRRHGKILWLLLVLVIAAILGDIVVTAQLKSQQLAISPTPSQIVPPTPTQTESLKTYTNTKHNYSIQYPGALLLEGDPVSDFVTIDKQITIEVSPNDPGNCRGDCAVGGGHKRNTVVNDISGYEFEGYIGRNGRAVPQEFLQVVLPHNDVFYIFTVKELKTDHKETINRELADLKDVDPKAVALFKQILSTFTLSQDPQTANWKTYESAAAGLSFQYPDDFVVEETPNTRISINYKNDNKRFLILQYTKREPTSYIQESEKYYADGITKGCKVDEISTVTVDQTDIKVYENFTCEGQTNTPLIIYSKNNITYDASVFGKTDQDVLARILATFKFTSQAN